MPRSLSRPLVVPTLLLSTLFAACLPDRFRDGDGAIDSGADRSDLDATDATDVTSADSADTGAMQDVADVLDGSMDASDADATAPMSDAADATSGDAADSGADARDAASEAGVCATLCTANEACVAGACVARNCQGVRERIALVDGGVADTTAMIDPDGAGPESAFSVLCADMASAPKEYIPVPAATNRRVNVGEAAPCSEWTTQWSHVRLLIDTSGGRTSYAVDAADFRFATDVVTPACRADATFTNVRSMQPSSIARRIWSVSEACSYNGLNNFAEADLTGSGFRFPADRARRFKFEPFSSGQATLFVIPQSAYSYRIAGDAICGRVVPFEFDRAPAGLPDVTTGAGYAPEFIATFRVPIERAAHPTMDAAPGSSCDTPLPVNPIGWDLSWSGVVTVPYSAFRGTAPSGAGCSPSGSTQAVWVSVELPPMTMRRLTAVSTTAADYTGLRLVDRCDGTCSTVVTSVGLPGRTSVVLDNSTGATARTFVIAVNAETVASVSGTARVFFVTQPVEPMSCFDVTVANAATRLAAPTQNAPADSAVATSRRVTFRTTLPECATGSVLEYCTNASCTTSLCGSMPCRIDVPAATPEFTVSFPQAGTFYWRVKSVRRWMPAAMGEFEYDPIPVGAPGPTRAIVVP